jgi:hypothetical protein
MFETLNDRFSRSATIQNEIKEKERAQELLARRYARDKLNPCVIHLHTFRFSVWARFVNQRPACRLFVYYLVMQSKC